MIDNILTLTKEFMSIHSVSSETTHCVDILKHAEKQLDNYAFTPFASNGIPSLLYSNTGKEQKDFKVILNAHLDVVPAEEKQLQPRIEDGKLYGRGAYDMKAAAAAMILVFKEIGHTLPYSLGLQLVTDEETGGFHGTGYQVAQGVRGDFVITGDCGSNLAVINKSKGILWLKLHAKGVSAHGAYLWNGENALWKLQFALRALEEAFPVPKNPEWTTTMNLARIETSNSAFNHVPDNASAYLDFRFIEDDKEHIIEKVKTIIPSDVEVEVMFGHAPEYVAPENQFVQLLQKSTKDVTGRDIPLNEAHAPSDLRHFNEVGCLGVQFGPVGHHQHGEGEWVDIKSIEEYYKILHRFLTQIA